MKISTLICFCSPPDQTTPSFSSFIICLAALLFAFIARTGSMMVQGEMLPLPSFNCPSFGLLQFMSQPFAVLHPIVEKKVHGFSGSYPALPDQSTLA